MVDVLGNKVGVLLAFDLLDVLGNKVGVLVAFDLLDVLGNKVGVLLVFDSLDVSGSKLGVLLICDLDDVVGKRLVATFKSPKAFLYLYAKTPSKVITIASRIPKVAQTPPTTPTRNSRICIRNSDRAYRKLELLPRTQ